MAVRQFVINLDNDHFKALMPGQRLDVDGQWKTAIFIRPIDGDAFEAESFSGTRAMMAAVAAVENASIIFQAQMGFIAGGNGIAVPLNFAFGLPGSGDDPATVKFDAKYGLAFPTSAEIVEDRVRRGL